MDDQVNDVGGVIAIDQEGNFGKAFTTPIMGWASIQEKSLQFGSTENDVKEEPL